MKHKALLAARVVACAAWLTAAVGWSAGPFTPATDEVVLERLPTVWLASTAELRGLRERLDQAPGDVDTATSVASRFVQLGKQQGDPRFYGYARAALAPWWDQASPPPEVLRLRAKLNETDHAYDLALKDLRLLTEKAPRDVQAWIEVSNILRVQGEYDAARQARDRLAAFADSASVMFCSVPLQAATGQAEQASAALEKILPVAREKWTAAVPWVVTMQADVARLLGHDEQAEQKYREGLSNDPADFYLLRAYADFLLDQDRPQEVIPLLRDHTTDTGVLLRAAIAARHEGETAQAEEWTKQLGIRFEEIRLRGSEPHGRYEARYTLELLNQPEQALKLALANWAKQKEMRDSSNVLEAAIAAADPAAAQPVVDFLTENQSEDVDLLRLVKRLARLDSSPLGGDEVGGEE